MLSKIILTLTVIMVCMWLISSKRNALKQPAKNLINPEAERFNKTVQRAAIAFMILMVLAAGAMIYIEIADQREIMAVHVINTQTGLKTSYQARKDDIQSSGFTTVEGMKIFVAGVERVEIEALE